MKKRLSLLVFSALAVFALLLVMPSCEGPVGPAGEDGAPGLDGTDGTDGVDANSFCIECHTMDNKNTVKSQFAMSAHGLGPNVGYAGGRSGCAKCHSYQGAMETMLTGRDTTAANIAIPVAFKCDMCHDFHGSLDEADFPDYALRGGAPVSLLMDDHVTKIDLAGSGNACADCHQTRRATEPYNGDSVNINSTHWGGHHGPQGNILAGVGAFEPQGSMVIGNTAHTSMTGCSDCHMNKEGGAEMGGHNFSMKSAAGVENIAACTACHASATSFDVANIQSDVESLLEDLHGLLVEHGLYSEESMHEGGHPVTGMYPANKAGAVFNYILFEEDRSLGVHNPKYVKAVLTNTIEMVETW